MIVDYSSPVTRVGSDVNGGWGAWGRGFVKLGRRAMSLGFFPVLSIERGDNFLRCSRKPYVS